MLNDSEDAILSDLVWYRYRYLVYLFIAPAVFDYRFITTGAVPTLVPLALFAIMAGAFCRIWSLTRFSGPIGRFGRATILIVVISFVVGLCRGQSLEQLGKGSIAFVEFFIALQSLIVLRQLGLPLERVTKAILNVGLFAVLMTLIMVASFQGLNLTTVRYQILSGAAPLITAYAGLLLVTGGFFSWRTPFLGIHIFTLVASVTRTLLLVGAAAIAMALIWSRRLLTSGTGAIGVFYRLIVVVAIGGMVFLILPNDLFVRWAERLFAYKQAGVDVTELTRRGEVEFQIGQLSKSVGDFIFGYGLQGPLSVSSGALERILQFYNGGDLIAAGMGHNTFVSLIYCGGAIGGLAMLWNMASTLAEALHAVASGVMSRGFYTVWIGGLPAVSTISYIVYAAFGDPFGYRQYAFFFGLSIALLKWQIEDKKVAV